MSEKQKRCGQCWTRRAFLKTLGGLAVGTAALASGVAVLREKKSMAELGRDQVIEYQELCRPKIEALLGAGTYDRCCAAMLREHDKFAPQLPPLEDRNNRDIFLRNAPFILSLYRALRGEFALKQDAALDTLGQITDYKVRENYANDPVMTFIMSRIAESDLVRSMFLKMWERQDELYGWTAEFPESDAYVAVDVTRCGLIDWYTDQGAPEVGPIGCQGDFVMAEFMTGLELVRTKTIADGDGVCDFRYIKKSA